MSEPSAKQQMVENEVIFREHNERVKKSFDQLRAIAKEDRQEALVPEDDQPLHFYCECSDENCQKRIRIEPSRYTQIHQQRDHFIVIPGHETDSIEHVIAKEDHFVVIKKFIDPPETAPRLHKTDVNNS